MLDHVPSWLVGNPSFIIMEGLLVNRTPNPATL